MYFGNAQYGGDEEPNNEYFPKLWGDAMDRTAKFAMTPLGIVVIHVAMAALIICIVVFFMTLLEARSGEGYVIGGGRKNYNAPMGGGGVKQLQDLDWAYAGSEKTSGTRPGAIDQGILQAREAQDHRSKRESMTSETALRRQLGK
jgi:hypothetical protein